MAFTSMLLVFMLSFQLASYDTMKSSMLRIFDGFGQFQIEGYRDDPEMDKVIADPAALLADLERVPGVAVAAARGIRLPDGVIADALAFFDGLPPGSIPSMHRDIAGGRPSELEQLSGAVVRLGRECGVATPIHQFMHAALLPSELAARGP